jgi:hypothetical protein
VIVHFNKKWHGYGGWMGLNSLSETMRFFIVFSDMIKISNLANNWVYIVVSGFPWERESCS